MELTVLVEVPRWTEEKSSVVHKCSFPFDDGWEESEGGDNPGQQQVQGNGTLVIHFSVDLIFADLDVSKSIWIDFSTRLIWFQFTWGEVVDI